MAITAVIVGVAGAALAAGASMYGAEQGRKTANANRKAQETENERQLRWAREQQGWYGSPTWLQGDMGAQENEAIDQATDIWNATYRDPTQAIRSNNEIADMLKPMAFDAYSDIGSGAWLDKSLANLQPMQEARVKQARGVADSWGKAIQERLKAIDVSSASGGFGSASAASRNNLKRNEFAASRASSEALGQAKITNEQENSAAKSAYQALRLDTGTNAPRIAQSLMAMDSIGTQQAVNDFSNRSNVFSNFAVQRGGPLNTRAAITQPYESAGAAGLASLAGSASGLGGYFAQRQNSEDMQAMIAALRNSRSADYDTSDPRAF